MQLKIPVFLALLLRLNSLIAQSDLSLEKCLQAAATHQPLAEQAQLIQAAHHQAMQLLNKQNWLQTNLAAQTTWQSDVTSFPLMLPGIEVPQVSKDQYRFTLDLVQPIYDGGQNRNQKQLQTAQTQLEQARLATELYSTNEQVIQLYSACLLVRKQEQILAANRQELLTRQARTAELVRNGTSIESQLHQISVRLLELDQQTDELNARKAAARTGLQLLTGLPISENLNLAIDAQPTVTTTEGIARPELSLYAAQRQATQAQSTLLDTRLRPRLNAIGTLGYARPGLNLLSNDFSPYAIVGLNLRWNLSALYTGSLKNERKQLSIQAQRIDAQQNQFLTLTRVRATQQEQEIQRLTSMAAKDREIVGLRKSIVQTAQVQLDNGVITETDYLTELTAQTNAELNAALHSLQLLQAQWMLQHINGNLKY